MNLSELSEYELGTNGNDDKLQVISMFKTFEKGRKTKLCTSPDELKRRYRFRHELS